MRTYKITKKEPGGHQIHLADYKAGNAKSAILSFIKDIGHSDLATFANISPEPAGTEIIAQAKRDCCDKDVYSYISAEELVDVYVNNWLNYESTHEDYVRHAARLQKEAIGRGSLVSHEAVLEELRCLDFPRYQDGLNN